MAKSWREELGELLSPLSLAAYAAWGSVWMAASGAMDADPASGWALRIALLAFLLLLMLEHLVSDRLGRFGFALVCATLALIALWVTSMTPRGASPILLVLLSAVLATRLSWRALSWALVAINLAMAIVIFAYWPGSFDTKLISVFAYASFQVFAALVMRYAAQSEEMSGQLRAANADLLATRELLAESTRDAERLRVARELHDIAGHKLTALKLNLNALARDPRFADAPQPGLCARLADELLGDIRSLVERIRHDDGLNLHDAMAALASPFPRPRTHIEVAEDVRAGSLAQAESVLRTMQEALTNAARHSQAQNLWVVLRREHGQLQLDIRDDGRGKGTPQPGNGLTGMRERLETAGGGLRILRTDTGGVHLQAWLPTA